MHGFIQKLTFILAFLIVGSGSFAFCEEPVANSSLLTNLDQLPYEYSQTEIPFHARLVLRARDKMPEDDLVIPTLEFQIWSTQNDTRVYNPHLRRLIPSTYNIAVFDQSKLHVGNLRAVFRAGSSRLVTPSDWVAIPENCGTCRLIEIQSAQISRPWTGDTITLTPGKYELQVVANSMLFQGIPKNEKGRYDEDAALGWPHERVNADAWRSNRVTIEIKSDDPTEPMPSRK